MARAFPSPCWGGPEVGHRKGKENGVQSAICCLFHDLFTELRREAETVQEKRANEGKQDRYNVRNIMQHAHRSLPNLQAVAGASGVLMLPMKHAQSHTSHTTCVRIMIYNVYVRRRGLDPFTVGVEAPSTRAQVDVR